MNETTLRETLMQASAQEASALINQTLRTCVRAAFFDAMAEEVTELCGPKHHPSGECRRAGSEVGSAYLEGEKEAVIRPRVRDENGEVHLATYAAASSQQTLFEEVVSLLAQGLSQRGIERAKPGTISNSAASRMWVEKSREQLAEVRGRDPLRPRFRGLDD